MRKWENDKKEMSKNLEKSCWVVRSLSDHCYAFASSLRSVGINLDVVYNLVLLAKLIDKASKNTVSAEKFCL